MAQYVMLECSLQSIGSLVETLYLELGKIIKVTAVTAHKMREHRAGYDGCLPLQTVYQFRYILGSESQTVHAGIDRDMYGEVGHTVMLSGADNHVEQMETVDLGLQFLVEQGVERCALGVHDHDVGGDAGPAQVSSLIGHSHSQVVNLTVLQCLGHLDGT